jgi:hypothetical protein
VEGRNDEKISDITIEKLLGKLKEEIKNKK